MVTPFHQYASVPVFGSTAAVHERIMTAPAGLVATATATALSRLEPLVRSWGLSPTSLPTVTATRVTDAFGSVEVRWSGEEEETLWPSLVARLLVVPDHPGTGARIVLISSRSPGAELATNRLDTLHRRRVISVATQGFLHDLAAQLTESHFPAIGPGASNFDGRPLFLHHVEGVPVDPDELVRRLTESPQRLADEATTAALRAAAEPLAAGRFRSPATPQVRVEQATADQLGVLRLIWESDEEASGWPQMSLLLAVEATSTGSRLAALSTREPSYDLSVNRIDKHERDRVIRHLGSSVLDATLNTLMPALSSRESTRRSTSVASS